MALDGLLEDINETHSPAEYTPIIRAAQERLVPLVGRAKAGKIIESFISERSVFFEEINRKFFELVKNYRSALDKLNAYYDPRFADVEAMKGSEAYSWKKPQLDSSYSNELADLRDLYRGAFESCLWDMDRALERRSAVPPTQEQLALLQLLQTRDTVGKDELALAMKSMNGCPSAEAAVSELAHKHGRTLGVDAGMSTETAQKIVETLRRNTEGLLSRIDRTDSAREYVSSRDWRSFMLSREPSDAADALRILGCCTQPEKFSALVDETAP